MPIDIENWIRAIPDYPKTGIIFRDVTPLLKNRDAVELAIERMVEPYRGSAIGYVAGMEARGFIFGAFAARALNAGFIPMRKAGKLPYRVHRMGYQLEYGSACLEIHTDAMSRGDKVLLVDDLLATGGTANAACKLVESTGAQVVGCSFLIELTALAGRRQLAPHDVHSVITYEI